MHFKFLSLLAVLLLVSGCASDPETSGMATGQGAAASSGGVSRGGVTPGSSADFVTNVGDRVFFDFDKATLAPEAINTLRKQAAWVRKYPNTTIPIEGQDRKSDV